MNKWWHQYTSSDHKSTLLNGDTVIHRGKSDDVEHTDKNLHVNSDSENNEFRPLFDINSTFNSLFSSCIKSFSLICVKPVPLTALNDSDDNRSAVVMDSLKRALISSFGSIAMGSLCVAIIKAMKTTVLLFIYTTDKINSFINMTLGPQNIQSTHLNGFSCLQRMQSSFRNILINSLSFLDKAMEYFNTYAFCYVAVYDYDFIQASK